MKRVGKMNTKAARQFSTLCLSGALTLGAFGEAQAAGNDAALQALFAQANYWHEKSHDELAMESLQKVLSVDANNAQALYLMALWAQQGGNLQARPSGGRDWRKRRPTVPACRIWIAPKKWRRSRRGSSTWPDSRRAAATCPPRWRPGGVCSTAAFRLPDWRRNTT